MAYEYEIKIPMWLEDGRWLNMNVDDEVLDELEEVYRKAKAFDEIVIETTGTIMNCPPGVVETEAGRITLDIIEKYDLEDE